MPAFTPIDPATDELIGRTSAEISLRNDRRTPSPATWSAWCHKGMHGIKLPSVTVGGRRLTTVNAFAWWICSTTTAADGDDAQQHVTTASTRRAAEQRVADYAAAAARNEERFAPKRGRRKVAK